MANYEFLEHTADAKFRAFGTGFEEMFSNAAIALTSIMINPKYIVKKNEKKIRVIGDDMGSLLYNFLEEILFVFDTEFLVVSEVKNLVINPIKNTGKKAGRFRLECTLLGDLAEKYKINAHIKAMTYNDLEITADYVQVVVDL